ncbi:retinol dehydrogenase 7-like [Ptychodera flava]|uniref:retinol dehydrogenase 7-like n=1 Tax=Ptychodera flava TaxID=63121 RepID=UPI00396A434E
MALLPSLFDFCYTSIVLAFALVVAWRYFCDKSIELSWHMAAVVTSLPVCYLFTDSIGILAFALICVIVYECLPVPHLDIEDKAVLITGCDSGFGHAAAKHLDSLGFQVFAGCLVKGGKGEQQLINNCSGQLTTLQLDVTKQEQIDEAFNVINKKLDGKGLWGLVNNAGIISMCNVELLPIHVFQKVWDINCLGGIRMIKKFLPLIRKSKGRIVNLSSVAGRLPFAGASAYCVSKAGLEILSDVLRQELVDWGVTVSIIEPSGFQTDIAEKDKLEVIYRNVMDGVNEEIRTSYNIEDYSAKVEDKLNKNEMIDRSLYCPDLSLVVDVILDALLSTYPKSRYPIGQGSKTIMWSANHLPSVILDLVYLVISTDLLYVQPKRVR